MAGQNKQVRVLRIGIIQDGKMVQERLIKAGDSVTIGDSPKNTFVLPKLKIPAQNFALFKAGPKGYQLQFTDQMKGKISSGGAVVQLSKLSEDPSVNKKGGVATLPLTDQDRGKISVDSVTILFQFVAPPPVRAVKPIQQMDFRPRILDDDDPVFLGFLGIWTALGAVLAIWVWQASPQVFTLDDVPERFVKIVIPDEPPPPDVELPPDDSAKEVEKAVEAEKAPKSESDKLKAEAKRKDDIQNQSKLLMKIIGTTGESSSGLVENLWSDEEQGLPNIDSALSEMAGATTDASQATRLGAAGGNGAADIGDLSEVGGGNAGNVTVAVKVKPKVSAGSGSIDGTGDENQVKSTVGRYSGQLQYCYEKQMKINPSLEGRIEVGWSVSAGLVAGTPYIIANTTEDAELADCVVKKIRRWEFPADVEGSMTWPFLFQQKK